MKLNNITIFKNIRYVGRKKTVDIQLFTHAPKLYALFDKEGYIEGLESTPLLGNIKRMTSSTYTRYDYIMLQVFIYQLVKDNTGDKFKFKLEFTMGSKVDMDSFINSAIPIEKT